MEHLPQLIIDLALLLTAAGITTLICKKLKQPLVLGYVIAGFLISPAIGFLPNVIDTASIETWSEIGVIFLMFGLGLEFSIMKLTSVGRPAIITALTEMIFMIVVGFTCGTLMGWSFFTCLFLGGMISISSTTIIIKAFDDLGMKGKKFTELVFGSLVIEDIVAIFLMVVLSTVALGSSVSGDAVGAEIAVKIGEMALYLIIWFVLSVIFVPTLLQKVAKTINDEILLIIAIALCLCMVVLANVIGFSSALGAFIAGSILAGTVQAHRIERLFKPVKNLFGAVFFVSVGMLVSPQLILENIIPIIVITLAVWIGQPTFATLGALLAGKSFKTSLQTGMSLSQIGEFSFIIAALGVSLGVTADFLYPVIVAVSVITTFTTPFYIKSTDRVYALLVKIVPDAWVNRIDARSEKSEEPKSSTVWGNYLKHWVIKNLMVIIAAVASVTVMKNLISPLLALGLPGIVVDLFTIGIALVVTGVFITNQFHSAQKGEFGILWAAGRRYHLQLILLLTADILIAFGAVVYIVFTLEATGSLWIIIPALIVTLIFARSKKLHSRFLILEARFVGNLNEKILAEKYADRDAEERIRWITDRLKTTTIVATEIRERRGKRFPIALLLAQASNLDLISLKRDGISRCEKMIAHSTKRQLRERINDPDNPLNIEKGDLLTFLGTEDEIEAFFSNMRRAGFLKEEERETESLAEYLEENDFDTDPVCFSVRIDSRSDFRGKTIEAAAIRERFGCVVIGMERKLLPITKPNRNTVILQGDYLLLLGDRRDAEHLDRSKDEVIVPDMSDFSEALQG